MPGWMASTKSSRPILTVMVPVFFVGVARFVERRAPGPTGKSLRGRPLRHSLPVRLPRPGDQSGSPPIFGSSVWSDRRTIVTFCTFFLPGISTCRVTLAPWGRSTKMRFSSLPYTKVAS